MHILLFIFYSLLCCYGIVKIPFIRKSGIRPALLLGLFALHVLTGCLHNIIAWRYYPGHGDIWAYFEDSFQDRALLTSHLDRLFADNSRWRLLSHNTLTFIQIILDLFSFDNLYINTLLLSFPVFMGNTALFRVFRRRFPADPLTAITVFLIPSTLFWTSCIHREGLLYMFLGFLFYFLDRLFVPSAPRTTPSPDPQPRAPRRPLYATFFFLLIAYFRPVVAALLVPALLAWWFTERPLPRRRAIILAAACAALLLILLMTPGLSTWPVNLLRDQQSEFRNLEGHSRLYLPALDGSWSSLLRVLPSAIRNGLFEPLPGSGGHKIYLVFSLELILIWGIVFAAIALHSTHPLKPRLSAPPPLNTLSFSRCCLLFSLSGMLLIGIIVPFAGAIVRYRSLYLPFLLAPCLHSLVHWPPLRRLNDKLKFLIS